MNKQREEFQAKIISITKHAHHFIRVECEPLTKKIEKEFIGGYIKFLNKESDDIVARTLSIADINSSGHFLIDIVDHKNNGPAQTFFQKSIINQEFTYYGPGEKAHVHTDKIQYFFIGDYTAFPAIYAQIKRLENKKINLLLIGEENSIEYFKGIENLNIKVVKDIGDDHLQDMAKEFNIVQDFIWAAGERTFVNKVRSFLKKNYELTQLSKYLSSYWQNGLNQESHSKLKKEDQRV